MRRRLWRNLTPVGNQPHARPSPRSRGHTDEPEAAIDVERMVYRRRVEVFLAGREAGETLTQDALREGVSVDALIDAAIGSAVFADEALRVLDEEYQPAIECREGCAYCCCKPGVLVTVPEVFRILREVRGTWDPGKVAALQVRAARYAALMHGRHFNDFVSDSVPCPLLVDGRCSIYEVRPLVCRGFNSTSADACRQAHEQSERLIPMFAILKDATDGTTVGMAQHLGKAGLTSAVVDLGTALHIALESGEELGVALVQPGSPLVAAEDSSWVADLWNRLREIAREVDIEV